MIQKLPPFARWMSDIKRGTGIGPHDSDADADADADAEAAAAEAEDLGSAATLGCREAGTVRPTSVRWPHRALCAGAGESVYYPV
jgi:hypothetical protein